ncbi:MAG: CPBP family intramembrane glutamic endopeptidase [Spirochaetota bacterium]
MRASPTRPLLEALLFFSAFWLRAYIPGGSASGANLASASAHLGILLTLLPSMALLLYLMVRLEGLAAFGINPRPRPREVPAALILAGLALGIGLFPEALRSLTAKIGETAPRFDNPLLASIGQPELSPFLFVPLVFLSSMATGYAEELFFRVYLLSRLALAGFGFVAALAFSSILFGLAHGRQGLAGAVIASILGALFALRWQRKRSWHEIAIGHGIYDFVVLMALFYGSSPPTSR